MLVSQRQIKVRLLDIDAPERRQPFGTRSRQSLADLCAGKDARIAEQGKDRYGRTLQVTVELEGGRLCIFQFCPGERVSACMVA